MRRRNPFGGTRTRKVRPAISVKEKPAARTAKCTACHLKILKGDTAVYVRVRTRRFHKACAPANVGAPPVAGPTANPMAMPADATEARLFAMRALENALMQKAKREGFPDVLEKAFDKYKKIKELAMRPGTEGEGATALRLALIEVIKATF